MAYGRRWHRLRIAVPLILLVMILMRLVWMQLRTYVVEVTPRAMLSFTYLHQDLSPDCTLSHSQGAPWWNGQPAEGRLSERGGDEVPGFISGKGVAKAADYPGLLAGLPYRTALTATRAWLASPGYAALAYAACRAGGLDDRLVVRLNQWTLVAAVMMAALMARFITSSWTLALSVGAMLLSRGRLLGDIGDIGADFPVMAVVTAWTACAAHFLRTGAASSLVGGVLLVWAGVALDPALLALGCVFPLLLPLGYLYRRRLARPVIKRLRGHDQRLRDFYPRGAPVVEGAESSIGRLTGSVRWLLGLEFPPPDMPLGRGANYHRGALFRTISVPFLLWAFWRQRWARLTLFWLGAVVVALLLIIGLAYARMGTWPWVLVPPGLGTAVGGFGTWLFEWWYVVGERLDLHFAVSLALILFCAAQSPAAGLASFLECCWVVVAMVVLLVVASLGLDYLDGRMIRQLQVFAAGDNQLLMIGPRPVLLWVEPVILCLGVACIYNLMKVLDFRFADKS